MTETKTVTISVYADKHHHDSIDKDVFGVLENVAPGTPNFTALLDDWVTETYFSELEPGDSIVNAGTMKYKPHGKVVSFEKTE